MARTNVRQKHFRSVRYVVVKHRLEGEKDARLVSRHHDFLDAIDRETTLNASEHGKDDRERFVFVTLPVEYAVPNFQAGAVLC